MVSKKLERKGHKACRRTCGRITKNRNVPDGKEVFGEYRGVRVGIIKTNGKTATIFPDSDQSSVLEKRKNADK